MNVGDAILYDALIVTIGITTYQYAGIHKRIKKVLAFFGNHSMSMFLTHTFIFDLWTATRQIVYATKNPLIIYLTCVGLSLLVAIVLDKIKTGLKFSEVILKLRIK